MKTNSALGASCPVSPASPSPSCPRGRGRARRGRDRKPWQELDRQKLLHGDAEEWRGVFRRARDLARFRCSGVEGIDHEDVAQDACVKLLAELGGVDEIAAYLSRVVLTTAIDARRREATRRLHELLGEEAAGAAVAQLGDGIAQELMACPKLQEKIGSTLRTLNGQLLQRWCSGERLEDLCASTGLPRTNVHRRIHAAARVLTSFVDSAA